MRASASESRSQARNRELALERLAAKLDAGLRVAAGPDAHAADQELPGAPGGVQAAARRETKRQRRRRPGEDD